ncbi:MAG: hypothetical protein M4579_002485 [Chaenotheca gracillima]|nr:MAG: hypothetical protein M4579_002485 [Chaenotheca gracillima]
MQSPRTPSKPEGALDRINAIVGSLSARWKLDLPLLQAVFTPSKVGESGRGPEARISSRIKFLFYKDEPLLRRVVQAFEQYADRVQRKEAPNGTTADKSPERRLSRGEGSTSHVPTSLLQHLSKLLDNACDVAKRGLVSSRPPSISLGAKLDNPLDIPDENNALPVSRRLFSSKSQTVSSSSAYGSMTLEDFGVLDPMPGASAKSDSSEDGEPQVFSTPPSIRASDLGEESPSQRMAALELDEAYDLSNDHTFEKTIDRVPIPSPSPSSKRRRPLESSSPPEPRKISKVNPFWVNVNAYSAVPESTQPFQSQQRDIPHFLSSAGKRQSRLPLAPSLLNNQSFTSDTSVDTTFNSTPLWDDQGLPAAPTTANTSFRSEAPPKEDHFKETITSRIEDALNKDVTSQYHSKLLEQTPFSMENSAALDGADFRTRWEITRVALELNVLPGEIFKSLPTRLVENPTTLWNSMRKIARDLERKLPEKSSVLAWERAGSTFEKVSLSAEFVPNDSLDGPSYKLRLKPLKLAASHRLDRRFGSDRFISIVLPALNEQHLPKGLRRDPDAARNAIVNWLGCSRLSKKAAQAVANALGLYHVPSAFQGRIAGAKGMWLVDHSGQSLKESDRDYWIEVSDSQWKFNVHLGEDFISSGDFDSDHLTFEVHRWSKPLAPAALNLQLISVLTQFDSEATTDLPGGKAADASKTKLKNMRAALNSLFEECLIEKVKKLREEMDCPALLRKSQPVISATTLPTDSQKTVGALLSDGSEQIKWFLDCGFRPDTNPFLNDLCQRSVLHQKEQLQNRMNITLARSTRCFMIPDPTGVLAEGEIQLCFSKRFTDPDSLYELSRLSDVDVLVSRNPAHCPWDIQKVRAVVRKELLSYEDVVLFSTRGSAPLASILSGGDYDGDEAWVCWEPRLVENFESVPLMNLEKPEYFGITRQSETLNVLNSFNEFLQRNFTFNLQPSLLGSCTKFFEKLIYHQRSISKPAPILLGTLLGHLVDESKQGYNFSSETWEAFLQRLRQDGYLPPGRLLNPAYAEGGRLKPTDHILDQLILVISDKIIEKEFTALHSDLQIRTKELRDGDLSDLWYRTTTYYEMGEGNRPVMEALRSLMTEVNQIFHETRSDIDTVKGNAFAVRMDEMHARFNQIAPVGGHPVVKGWAKDFALRGENSLWALLKASYAYFSCPKGKMVWWIAGKQLGQLKAEASDYRPVVAAIHSGLKMDSRFAKKQALDSSLDLDNEDTGSAGYDSAGDDSSGDCEL